MLSLSNNDLTVSILDPIADATHLGSRYCTGGYIRQIEDRIYGPLLSGPRFPDKHPPPFDGQGAPEVFVATLGKDDCAIGEKVTVIGVGEVLRTSETSPFHVRDNPMVSRFCSWDVETGRAAIRMSTDQKLPGFDISVMRSVVLEKRTVISKTQIINRSEEALPIRWFAHPFFPLNPDLQCCRLLFPYTIPENQGYTKSADGTLLMRNDYNWNKGLFQRLEIPVATSFTADIFHPVLSSIRVTADYPLHSLPVWANSSTFSLEPYLLRYVDPGAECTWKIEYRFNC